MTIGRTRRRDNVRGCASASGTPPRSSPAKASLPAAGRRENNWADSFECGVRSAECGMDISEQPRGSASCARPINSNPSPRRMPRSSVWIAATEKTFARSKTRIKPVSPSATSRPVSGEMICARAHGGNWKLRHAAIPAFRTATSYACELNSLMPYSQMMFSRRNAKPFRDERVQFRLWQRRERFL